MKEGALLPANRSPIRPECTGRSVGVCDVTRDVTYFASQTAAAGVSNFGVAQRCRRGQCCVSGVRVCMRACVRAASHMMPTRA